MIKIIPFLLFISFLGFSCIPNKATRVLVFTKTAGFYHKSIPDGQAALMALAQEGEFIVDTTSNAAAFNEDQLKLYQAVVFLNTTGDVLNPEQEKAFEGFIQKGGGFVGIHSAADTEYDWPWYGKLVGGYFDSHPKVQEAAIDVVDRTH